jgi:L-lactate dehydrogenase complex protein LldE
LLEKAGCRVDEMQESDRCCGFGGLFSLRMPEVSEAMTAEKLRQAADTGTDLLVTSDPGCLMQMRGLVQGGTLRVEHLATVVEEATR